MFYMPWGFTVLALGVGWYEVSDPFHEPFPLKCYVYGLPVRISGPRLAYLGAHRLGR